MMKCDGGGTNQPQTITSLEPQVAVAGLHQEGGEKISLTEAGTMEVNCGWI